MSLSFTLPEASSALVSAASKSCPAPSATAMTVCDFVSIRCFNAGRKASSLSGTSGISAKFTSWLAIVAPAVTNPAWRPISFTSPMPPGTLRASVCAQSSTRAASSTALANPKVRETNATSLSIVFGTPTTESACPRLRAS